MTSKDKKSEQKKEDTPGSPDMAVLATVLMEHKALHSVEVNLAFAQFGAKLDKIQTTITEHHQQISSLESQYSTKTNRSTYLRTTAPKYRSSMLCTAM